MSADTKVVLENAATFRMSKARNPFCHCPAEFVQENSIENGELNLRGVQLIFIPL